MSVINDMLDQLDRRNAQPVTVGGNVVSAAPLRASWRNARWKWLVLLAAAAALLATLLFSGLPEKLLTPAPAHVPRPISMGTGNESPTGAVAAADAAAATAPAIPTAAPTALAPAAPPAVNAVAPPVEALKPPAVAAKAAAPAAAVPDTVLPDTAGMPRPAPATATAAQSSAQAPAEVSPAPVRPDPKPAMLTEPPASEGSIDKRMASINPAQRAEQLYRQASELAAGGHSTQAIDRLFDTLKADPAHLAARQLGAVLLVEKGRLDEAAAVLRDGLDRAPAQPQLSYLLARIRVEAGDAAGALALLQGNEALSAEGFALRAGLLVRQGRHAEALPSYEAALRRNPDNAATWLGLAVALEAQGQAAPARQAYARAREAGALRGGLSAELQTYIAQKLSASD